MKKTYTYTRRRLARVTRYRFQGCVAVREFARQKFEFRPRLCSCSETLGSVVRRCRCYQIIDRNFRGL